MGARLSVGQIKRRPGHPIIGADRHEIACAQVFAAEWHRVGGEDAVGGWNAARNGALGLSPARRRNRRIIPLEQENYR